MPISVQDYQRVMMNIQNEETGLVEEYNSSDRKAGCLFIGMILVLAAIFVFVFQMSKHNVTWTPIVLSATAGLIILVGSILSRIRNKQFNTKVDQLRGLQQFLTWRFNPSQGRYIVNSESEQKTLDSILSKYDEHYTPTKVACAEQPDAAQCAHQPPCVALEGR